MERASDVSLAIPSAPGLAGICHGSAAGSQSGTLGDGASASMPSQADPAALADLPAAKREKKTLATEVIPQNVMTDVEQSLEVSFISNDSDMGASARPAVGLPPALPGSVRVQTTHDLDPSPAGSTRSHSIPPSTDIESVSRRSGGPRQSVRDSSAPRSRGKARSSSAQARNLSTGTRNLKMKRGGVHPTQKRSARGTRSRSRVPRRTRARR